MLDAWRGPLARNSAWLFLGAALAIAAFLTLSVPAAPPPLDLTHLDRSGAPPASLDSLPFVYPALSARWAPISAPAEAARWTFHRAPEARVTFRAGPDPVVVTDPGPLRATARQDGVVLAWAPPPARGPHPRDPARECERARLLGYVLSRGRPGLEAETARRFLPPEARSHEDRDVRPRATYVYRLEALFEHSRPGKRGSVPEVLGGRPAVADLAPLAGREVRIASHAPEVRVTTLTDTLAVLRGWVDGQALLVVWKYREGRWTPTRLRMAPGQPIGAGTSWVLVGKTAKGALVEDREVKIKGLGGLLWGTAFQVIPLSADDRPAELRPGGPR